MPSGDDAPWVCQTRSSTIAAATSSPTVSIGGQDTARRLLDRPREPKAWLFDLRQGRHRFGRLPHPPERDLVRELDDGVAEPPTRDVLLPLHVDPEQPLEHRVRRLVLAVTKHRFFDHRVRGEEPRAERV